MDRVLTLVVVSAALLLLATPGCKPGASTPPLTYPELHPSWFRDVTTSVGLDFIHDAGVRGQYFMPEQAGSGAALFDFNNDGRLDICLIQCSGPDGTNRNRLYRQENDGRFTDVTRGSGLDTAGYGMGTAAGDINNDGWTDLLITEYGAIRLFLNRKEGRFEDITKSAGLENSRWATAAAFLDYDRDGWLDLVIGNYLDYNPTHQCLDAAGKPEYCGPQNFKGTVARLFHNEGSNEPQFTDATVTAGLTAASGPALGVLCADFNGDHWPDIFLADDGRPNRLFINQTNGTFIEEATLRGLAYNHMGSAAGNMGVAVGDLNRDGLFDVFVTHLAEEQHSLWTQKPRGLFQDTIAAHGLANPRWRGTGFGAVMADIDQDGWLDLSFVNGLVQRGNDPAPRHPQLKPHWHPYAQRYQLFRNAGDGRMVDVSESNPAFTGNALVGRGLACGDINNDGAIDLLTTSTGGPAQLFLNVAPDRGHWLMIRALLPQQGGRDALGAEIIVRTRDTSHWRLIHSSYSYLVSNDPRAHIGLGSERRYDSIRIRWPDGTEEQFPGGEADRLVVLKQGSGTTP